MFLLESLFVEVSLIFLTLGYLFYLYATWTYNYWKDRGVPYVPPVPLFGTSLRTSLGREPNCKAQLRNYEYFGNNPFGGTYFFRRPILFIKDPHLIEQVNNVYNFFFFKVDM